MDADPADANIMSGLLLLLFFTLLSAFFTGAQMAVASVNRNRIRELSGQGSKKARLIEGLFEDSTKFFSAIQVMATLAGLCSGANAAVGIAPFAAAWLKRLNVPCSTVIAQSGVTLLLLFFYLVFGELVPKRIALQKAEGVCMLTVMPVYCISTVLSPFLWLMTAAMKLVLRLLGMKTEDQGAAVTEEEIRALLKQGNESGVFEDEEREMIDSVFAFDDHTAKDIMVPRREVTMLDISCPLNEAIDEILDSRHSRIPVYEGNVDDILGILYVKDVMIAVRRNGGECLDLRSLLHRPYFVPDTKDADELFREMQRDRRHMALLLDEYGGFSGIVTIEDLVEEIMGEIPEEGEETEPEVMQMEANVWIVDGSMDIEDLNEQLDLQLESENYNTFSGYLIELLGRIPDKEDRDVIRQGRLQFTIMEVQDNRITRVELRTDLPEEETEAAE